MHMRAQQMGDGTWAFSIGGGLWMTEARSIETAKGMGWSVGRWVTQAHTAIGAARSSR